MKGSLYLKVSLSVYKRPTKATRLIKPIGKQTQCFERGRVPCERTDLFASYTCAHELASCLAGQSTTRPLQSDYYCAAFQVTRRESATEMPSTDVPKDVGPGNALDDELVKRAYALDAADELRRFREEFHLPAGKVYLCGNSLGPMPKRAAGALSTHVEKWKTDLVDGHFKEPEPWISIEERVSQLSMPIVGARYPHEVAVMNSLTVNIHLFLTAFYKPVGSRCKILIERHAFPSDTHAVTSHVQARGLDEDAVVFLGPREGEQTLRTDDIIQTITKLANANQLALVLLPGVQFYTGQVLPMERIARLCSSKHIALGLDLAHAVGNIPLKLHDWGVDFAAWCNYKYLNGGPGAIGGAFLHDRWADAGLARHAGWWGSSRETRFDADTTFRAQRGARGFQLSNPSVLALAPVAASLSVFEEAGGVSALRAKSLQMMALLTRALAQRIGSRVRLLTPDDHSQRGNQLSMRIEADVNVDVINNALAEAGVVCDVRKPDVIRVAAAPLFNSFKDVLTFVGALEHVLNVTK